MARLHAWVIFILPSCPACSVDHLRPTVLTFWDIPRPGTLSVSPPPNKTIWHLYRQESDLENAVKALGSTKTERDINMLMRQHTLEREACEERWSSELSQLRDTQRREYRDWVTKVYEDMESQDHREKKGNC